MPNIPALTGIGSGGSIEAPSRYLFTYKIRQPGAGLPWTLSYKGGLRGVLNEPTFKRTINAGPSSLTLDLDHYPSELAWGDVIEVDYPNGQPAGYWTFESQAITKDTTGTYRITLYPLWSQMARADFNANYSTDTTQPTTPLGPQPFSVPVIASIAQTQNCSVGIIQDDGTSYSYAFNMAHPSQTLDQAIVFGGGGWWYYCDEMGVISLRNSSPRVWTWTLGRDAAKGTQTNDISPTNNIQPVTGGTPANATTALSATAADTNPANPYSIPNLGRRMADPYSDTSLLDQASVDRVAAALLDNIERETSRTKLMIIGVSGSQRPQPGDACYLRIPPDILHPRTSPYAQEGPFLILSVTQYGDTGSFDVEIASDLVVPFSLIQPMQVNIQQNLAINKLITNPAVSAVSADGTTGSVSVGVTTGTGGGSQYSSVPSPTVGLALSTQVGQIAQVNNSEIGATWSANPATDAVASYVIGWSQGGSTPTTTANVGNQTSYTILHLPQGEAYTVWVAAINRFGVQGPWSAPVQITSALDDVAPPVVTNLTSYKTPRGATLTFDGLANVPDLQGYIVQVAYAGGGFQWLAQTPSLRTEYYFALPKGTTFNQPTGGNPTTPTSTDGNSQVGVPIQFRVAAVDWSGNQSAWSDISAQTLSDGVAFDEIVAGNILATGTITGGSIQTGSTGARGVFDASGIRLYDGSTNNYGAPAGAGVTVELDAQTGSAFFSGTIQASTIDGSTINSTTLNSATIDSSTINSATIDSSTINSATLNSGTINSSTLNSATIDSSTINSGTMNSSTINSTDINTSQMTVVDGSGHTRVVLGNIATADPSSSGYGIAVFNASGGLIMDSDGLNSVLTSSVFPGGSFSNSNISFSTTTTTLNANYSYMSFTVSGTRNVYYILTWQAFLYVNYLASSWNYVYVNGVLLDGAGLGGSVTIDAVSKDPVVSNLCFMSNNQYMQGVIGSGVFVPLLAPGTYTMAFQYYCNTSSGTGEIQIAKMQALQVGT